MCQRQSCAHQNDDEQRRLFASCQSHNGYGPLMICCCYCTGKAASHAELRPPRALACTPSHTGDIELPRNCAGRRQCEAAAAFSYRCYRSHSAPRAPHPPVAARPPRHYLRRSLVCALSAHIHPRAPRPMLLHGPSEMVQQADLPRRPSRTGATSSSAHTFSSNTEEADSHAHSTRGRKITLPAEALAHGERHTHRKREREKERARTRERERERRTHSYK